MRDTYKDERTNSREHPKKDDDFGVFMGECCEKTKIDPEGVKDGLSSNKPMYRNDYERRN